MAVEKIGEMPMDATTPSGPSPIRVEPQWEMPDYFRRKALATRVLGGVLLVLFSPIILLLMALVCITSAGPGLYRQRRVGKKGHEFFMYKIRTMVQDAEAAIGPTWCRPGDSRITFVGRMLRFLHLDELPQLINIAWGEMDLIGPRPERPEFVEKLVNEIPDYAERLSVLPGVTGLAQINLPPDESIDCVRRKLVLDLEYIQTTTANLDLRILLCTALRMMGIRHGHAVRLFRLRRSVPQFKSTSDAPDLDMVATHAVLVLHSKGHHNESSSISAPHVPNASPVRNEESPATAAPRNPK